MVKLRISQIIGIFIWYVMTFFNLICAFYFLGTGLDFTQKFNIILFSLFFIANFIYSKILFIILIFISENYELIFKDDN